jgi:hypothetical protein
MNRAQLVRAGAVAGAVAAVAVVAAVTALAVCRGEAPLAPGPPPSQPRPADAGTPAATSGAGPHTLVGVVVDGAGGGVAGVVVSARRDEAGATAVALSTATTGGEGRFDLRGLEPGVYRLDVAGDELFPASVRYIDVPGDTLRVLVTRKVAIEGRVSEAGAPARGAVVEVAVAGLVGSMQATVDDAGGFKLEGLVEGEYQLWARRGPRAARVVAVARFGPGPFEPVALALESAAVVRGRVLDAYTGRGLRASVALADDADLEPVRRTVTDDHGRFAIEGVPFGLWLPSAHAVGYVATELLALDTQRATEVELRLARGGAIAGVVVDVTGRAIAGAAVVAEGVDRAGNPVVANEVAYARRVDAEGASAGLHAGPPRLVPRGELGVLLGPIPYPPPAGTVVGRAVLGPVVELAPPPPGDDRLVSVFRTDADGRFRVAGLPAGRMSVRVVHPGFAPAQSDSLRVQLGAELGPVRVMLWRGVVIKGRAREPDGAGVAGATVYAESEAGEPLAVTVAGPDGRFELPPISGDATVRATAALHAVVAQGVRVGPLGPELEVRELELVMARADGAITGRVVDATDEPIAGAAVAVEEGGLVLARTVTGRDGRFELAGVSGGGHPVRVEALGYPPFLTRGEAGRNLDVSLPPGGGVRLDVRDAHTTDRIGVGTAVARGPGGAQRSAAVARGEARLVGLEPGGWSFVVSAVGYVSRSVRADVPRGRGAGAITIDGLVVELERGAVVAGIVRDAHGERVAGARVTVGEIEGRTDADGRFRLVDVPTGDVRVRAEHDGASGEAGVPLRPGDELVTLEIGLHGP